jgi:ankyrin repeat protein
VFQSYHQKRKLQEKLWRAAIRGDCHAIRLLAANGVDIDARNEDGFTAFNLASQHNQLEAQKTILAARDMQYAMKLGIEPAVYFQEGGKIDFNTEAAKGLKA